MKKNTLSEALTAIQEEAEKLLALDLTSEVSAKVELILAIARYQFDVRTEEESTGPRTVPAAVDDLLA